MARKNEFVNGKPEPSNKCDDCGRPVHPSLECVCKQ